MSSNSGVIINRSNQTSAFNSALQSRNSKAIPQLYSSEINVEQMAFSKVEIESSTAAGYSRTMRIALGRYGILNRLYLHSTFLGTDIATAALKNDKNFSAVPFIGIQMIKEARLMYNGAVLAKLNAETIQSDLWKNSSRREKRLLQELVGAYDQTTTGTSAVTPDRTSVDPAARCLGQQDFYTPLDFFFSSVHSANRGLDLSVLANEVLLEIDVESSNKLWKQEGTGASVPELSNLSAVCHLTEMAPEVEKTFRAISYVPGGSPLTEICFDTTHAIVSSGQALSATVETAVEVRLNQFPHSVFRLDIYAVNADTFPTVAERFNPGQINEIQIKATGSNIYNSDNLSNKEDLLEVYNSKGDYYSKTEGTECIVENITCNPNHIYSIYFKSPQDFSKVSNSGSVAMSQLSTPNLRVVLPITGTSTAQPDKSFGAQNKVLAGPVDIHVIAYHTSLISYSTNTSGSTNIKKIEA